MKRLISFFCLLSAIGVLCLNGCQKKGSNPFVRYLAGMQMIDAGALSQEQKIAYHERLCAITGISPDVAQKRLQKYKSDPEAYKKIMLLVSKELTDTLSQ